MSQLDHQLASAQAGRLWRVAGSDLLFLALWLAAMAMALAIKSDQLLIGFDGGYMRDLARRQFEWGVPLSSTSIDFYQGVGDMFFSGANLTLLPSFFLGSLFGAGDVAKVVVYTVALIELTGALFLFGRALGLSRNEALCSAILLPLISFPFDGSGAIYAIIALTPQMASFIAAILLLAWAFLKYGVRGPWTDLPFAVLFLGIIVWVVHASAVVFVLAGPFLLVAGVSALIAARSRRERWAKLGLAAVATALSLAGPIPFLLGVVLNSAPVAFPIELHNDRLTLAFASILFHWSYPGPTGPLLLLTSLVGATIAFFDKARTVLRVFAITLFTYLMARLAFWAVTVMFDFWRGPSALYFEFFVIPLYTVFAVVAVSRLVSLLRRGRVGWLPEAWWRRGCLAFAGGLAIVLAATSGSTAWNFPYPPNPTPLTPFLEAGVAQAPPSAFRGRVATLTGRTYDQGVNWLDLHRVDTRLQHAFGNEMRLFGLHYFGIPSLFQYGSTISPAFYALTSRLLSVPHDRQMRGAIVLRHHDPRLLAMLGIRFVVTDAPFQGAEPVLRAEADGLMLDLYEVADPNLGTYSPTNIVSGLTATGILSRMAQADFDPRIEMMADVPEAVSAPPLSEATEARMGFDGVSIHVSAVSPGRSVLLLPLEYSRCLAVVARSGEPALVRANLMLTGLAFSGRLDATVSLRYGPFVNPTCRLRDFLDLLAIGIRDVPADLRPAAL